MSRNWFAASSRNDPSNQSQQGPAAGVIARTASVILAATRLIIITVCGPRRWYKREYATQKLLARLEEQERILSIASVHIIKNGHKQGKC